MPRTMIYGPCIYIQYMSPYRYSLYLFEYVHIYINGCVSTSIDLSWFISNGNVWLELQGKSFFAS